MIKQYKIAAGVQGRMVRPGSGTPEPWTLKAEALFEADELLTGPLLGTYDFFVFIRKGWMLEVPTAAVELVKTSSPRVKKEALPPTPPPPSAPAPAPSSLMPKELREKVHAALKMVAGVCNYARTWDNQGFSKNDAEFGHKLAEQSFLITERQAPWAASLAVKYQRQISDPDLIEAIRPFLPPKKEKKAPTPKPAGGSRPEFCNLPFDSSWREE